MSRPVHRANTSASRSSIASRRNHAGSSESLARDFSTSLEKSSANSISSESREAKSTLKQADGGELQLLSDDVNTELTGLRDDDLHSQTVRSSDGSEFSGAPLFSEQLELSQPQLHNNSMDAAEASRGVVDTSIELLMAEFRRLDTQRSKRSWQFSVDGAGIEVVMDLQQNDDGGWLVRLNLPQDRDGFNKQAILEDLQERMRSMDQQIQLEVEIGSPV